MNNNSNINSNEKFCTRCGHRFIAVGREVICPACKQAAAEDAKRAAVLKAKRASWNGESVPVRISGRASTVIRAYGKHYNLPFAAALDDLLKASEFFKGIGVKWEEVKPYKSHRRDKHTTETAQDTASKPQDVQAAQEVKQEEVKQDGAQATSKAASKPQEVTKAAKVANKNTTSTAAKKAVKTSKAAEKGGKA